MSRPVRTTTRAALACAGLLLLGACGSDTPSDSAGSGSGGGEADSAAPLFDQLPSDIQDAGTIVIGSSIDYPPFEYYAEDGTTLKGFEPELADALSEQLGVTFTWENASFDTLFTALRSGRYDIVYGAVNDTAEREQTFDFVTYLQSSQALVTTTENPAGIATQDDLCGTSIAIVRGGVQGDILEALSAGCADAGKDPIEVLPFDGNSGEQLAVKQGQADAMLENYPTAAVFAQESDGELAIVPDLQLSPQYFGMVVPKDQTELRDALQQGWQAIIDNGDYGRVLDEYGLSDIALDEAGINQAGEG
jgi:polar amino acid transport system substrate-binding protein